MSQPDTDVLEHVVTALAGADVAMVPWPHCYIRRALPEPCAREIEGTFDDVALNTVEGRDLQKTYRMHTHRVDNVATAGLPGRAWLNLVSALNSEAYRQALALTTGLNLSGALLTVDLWRYREGDWLAPHVDKPTKIVTQLFYFSRGWEPQLGGHLELLERQDSAVAHTRLEPLTGSSAVLLRSDSSWHAVEVNRGVGASRCSIAATFWKAERSSL